MKEAPKREIKEVIRSLKTVPDFGDVKLYLHQLVCFLVMHYFPRFMLFLDMGGGKTLLTLMMIRYRKQMGKRVRAVVFVPYITAIETWIEETAKHTPELVCVPLLGTSEENRYWLENEEGDIFVLTYQTGIALCSERIKTDKETKTGRKKVVWNFKAADVRSYFARFDTLVMDEIHKIKNASSLYYRMCWAISTAKKTNHVYGLTGTPHGREPSDLWAQFHVVDLGETLGETLGMFKEAFYSQSKGHWTKYEFKFRKKLKGLLHERIKHRSIRYEITECHDMPDRIPVPKFVRAGEGIKAYYDAAVNEIERLQKQGNKDYAAIESKWHQMRQLSSGFMTLKDMDPGSANEKHFIKFDENPKLDALVELIDTMPDGHKMIVFHDYQFTNNVISEGLTAVKIGHARVWGKGKDPIGELRRFKSDPKCRVLVINSKSGSSSLNLQIANYVVFFEQPASSIDREQAERRAWRPGQEWTVFIIDILMRGTEDAKQRKSNQEGRDLMRDVLDGKRKLRRLKEAA